MADLDTSKHSLNLSASKQKYSFSKSKRFQSKNHSLCEQIYSIPTTITKRTTALGYGQKTMGIPQVGVVPGVGTYCLQSQINPEKNVKRSISFGVSRSSMQLGGPLGHVKKFLQKLPAPGNYEPKDVRDRRAPSLRSRLPDHQFQKTTKNPGPGAYNHQELGKNSYYLSSKFRNYTNGRISQVSRLDPISKHLPPVGPADYKPVDQFNGGGRYSLAKHASTNSCVFGKSERKGIQQKSLKQNPGPGQYNAFSGFG